MTSNRPAINLSEEAAIEADTHRLNEAQVGRLRNRLPKLSPGDHAVGFDRVKWGDLVPPVLSEQTSVTRSDLFDIAQSESVLDFFKATFIWGTGSTGYGPRRCKNIIDSANGKFEDRLGHAIRAGASDLLEGYAELYGGHDPKKRSLPNSSNYSRIKGFGPAFFTKLLYFRFPAEALILDNVLARRVSTLSAIPYLVTDRKSSYNWSPYRYSVYLHWMKQTARALEWAPDELELSLFAARSDLLDPLSSDIRDLRTSR